MTATLSMLQDLNSGSDGSNPGAQEFSNLDLTAMVFGATGGVITVIFLGTIAAQAFGQEYRQGTIKLTLTTIPGRGKVFSAKFIVALAVVTAIWVIATVLTYLLMVAIASGKIHNANTGLDIAYLGRGLLFVLGFCAIVFGVVVLTRVLALGVILPIVFWAVAEPLLITLLGGSLVGSTMSEGDSVPLGSADPSWIERILPFRNGTQFVEATNGSVPSGLVFLAWVAVITVAAWFVFKKRDA